jgi:xylulokinase
VQDVFSNHGIVLDTIAASLGFRTGVSVSYKAGDQPNNALSLNVLEAGEVAATAGTSGVIYGVHDAPTYDPKSRINSFAHVNHTAEQQRIGVLLCINGTGILNRWVRDTTGGLPYQEMNAMAAAVPVGSDGLQVFPFGNGAERMLENKIPGAQIQQLDLNKHSKAHLFRAAQEGIAFAFRYGLDIMRSNNMHPSVIRAGRANMFLSDVFVESFVNTLNVPVELYQCDGSVGAALGAGIGCGYFKTPKEAFAAFKPERMVAPGTSVATLDAMYHEWKQQLEKSL